MARPDSRDYSPFMEPYISKVKGDSIAEIMANHHQELIDFYTSLPEDLADYAYAPGKWSVREVLSHVIDNDLVFSYRAMAISRGETQTLPGYDQEVYVPNAEAGRQSFDFLKQQFVAQRETVKFLTQSFSDHQLQKTGPVSDYRLSVGAACYILFGHALHHKYILETRYLSR